MFNSNNNPISSYHFNYDYFVSPGALAGNDEFRKRLKLTSLVHYDNSGSNGLTHTFEYIENVNLPSRLSRATDYWGFYNGKTSNWTFLPNGHYEAGIYSSRRSNLADRRAYPAYSVANTLKKITFPTGGHREFIYEGNQALREYSSQVQPDASYYINNYNLDDKQQFDYQNTYFYPNFPVYQKGFTVNSTDGETNFEYFLGGISGTGDFQVKIIGIVGFSEFEVQTFYNQTNADWDLSNGEYRIELYFTFTRDFSNISMYWRDLNLSSEVTYRYGEPYRRSNLNNGEIKEINYKYAFNLTSEFEFNLTVPEQQMKEVLFSENYLQPLEITVYLIRDGQPFFLEGSKRTFNYFNTAKKHLAVIKRYTTLTDYTEINLSEYDTNGNLTEVYKTDDVKEAYLWGYKGQYLVAKVVGSDYSTISGYVNNSILQNPSTDQQLRDELDKIRTGLANTTAQVITYTYDPLVGMTSQTDPNGETVHYTYDDFNRLKLIKNNDLNILQSYLYHYKGMLSQ